MTIKFANYAAFAAAEKKVARDVQEFRQMMSGAPAKKGNSSTKSAKAAETGNKGQSSRKGHDK